MIHVAGKIYVSPDTLSRSEVTQAMVSMLMVISDSDSDDSMEGAIETQVASNILNPVTWQQIHDDAD